MSKTEKRNWRGGKKKKRVKDSTPGETISRSLKKQMKEAPPTMRKFSPM